MGENDREQEFYQIVLTKDELIYFKINTAEGFQTIPQNVVFLVKDRYIYKEMTQILNNPVNWRLFMYCAICECEYKGWYGKCPNCKNPLLNEPHLDPLSSDEQISYERLVEIIRENGGALEVDLATIEVNKSKSFRFPWLGYGYAWAKRMRGASQGITVDFYTIEVGKDRKFAFPYLGHGYAWGKTIQGSLAGNEATLKAKKVNRKRGWNFPYFGYGYAWTEVMSGSCGEKLNLELITTKVGKNHRMRFPYFGFGYAWVDQAKITISLN